MTFPDAVVSYLDHIDVSPSVTKRVLFLARIATSVIPTHHHPIERLVVGEYVGNDGLRVYENVLFVAGPYCSEATNMMTDEAVDLVVIGKAIDRLAVKRTNFVPGNSDRNSRLTVDFVTKTGLQTRLRASGANCQYLHDFMREVIAANVV